MIKKVCKICKKEFSVFPYQKNKARYCSIKCSREGQWKYHKETMLNHLKVSQPLAWKARTGTKHSKKTKAQISKNRKGKYTGEINNKWKGDDVGYLGLHSWVQRKLGFPDTCEHCGKKGLSRQAIHWANKDHKYKRVVGDWLRLCASCHWKYDKKNNLRK